MPAPLRGAIRQRAAAAAAEQKWPRNHRLKRNSIIFLIKTIVKEARLTIPICKIPRSIAFHVIQILSLLFAAKIKMDLNKSVSLGVIFGLALFALYLLFPQTGGVGNLSTQWSFSQATSLRAKSSDSFHSSTVDTDVLPRPTDAILSLKSQTSHDFAENQDVLMGRDSFEVSIGRI